MFRTQFLETRRPRRVPPAGGVRFAVLAGLLLFACQAMGASVKFAETRETAPALDGSLNGWEHVEPVTYRMPEVAEVEVRCQYDSDNLYLRWDLEKSYEVMLSEIYDPQRIFTHEKMRPRSRRQPGR